jgi:NAD(P)-dependent dehydrogenase (short-subunit alcohol dehydrogenase family)
MFFKARGVSMAEQHGKETARVDRRTWLGAGAATLAAVAVTPVVGAQKPVATAAGGTLAGKVAVITGAARGIGRAIAVDIAAAGADVAGLDIAAKVSPIVEYPPATTEDLRQTGALVQEKGRRFLSITADIRNIENLRAAADRIKSELGRVDIVVANAGIQAFGHVLNMDDAHWNDVINVNLNGTANTLRVFAPYLVQQGGGRIIIIASGQGRHGTKNGSAYSASKWGVIGLMKSAALELGKHKITVNCIEPGLTDTAMTRNERRWKEAVMEDNPKNPPEHPTEEQVIQARLKRAPMKVPWLQPEDIAPVATFLASDGAALISGACYDVNGGESGNFSA